MKEATAARMNKMTFREFVEFAQKVQASIPDTHMGAVEFDRFMANVILPVVEQRGWDGLFEPVIMGIMTIEDAENELRRGDEDN